MVKYFTERLGSNGFYWEESVEKPNDWDDSEWEIESDDS
jgi:hypothetical protein